MNPDENAIPKAVDRIIVSHRGQRGDLIAILDDVQTKYRHLPEEALRIVAERTNRSLVDVYGVATFYKHFSLRPRGQHVVSVCLGTACHVRGGPAIAEEFERQLQVKPGCTTPDGKFTLETVNCLGACALAPIVVANGRYFSKVPTANAKRILRKVEAGLHGGVTGANGHIFPVKVRCACCNHTLQDPKHPLDGYPSVRLTMSFGGHHGWIRVSSLYGSNRIESEYEIPMDEVVHFFCPHCHAELVGAGECPECGTAMVPMIVEGGGMVQICRRYGCSGHRLDLNGVNA